MLTFFPGLASNCEPQGQGPGSAHCHGGRPEHPGLLRSASSCFCQLGLPAPHAKMYVQGDHCPSSEVTDFFGNAGGCVLKGSLFSQDNRSFVLLTMPFSFPPCKLGQPGCCPTSLFLHKVPCARDGRSSPTFLLFTWTVAGWLSACSGLHSSHWVTLD